nr:MAG TPA: hypothetical protein [Bacteriophage sp.]
MPDHHSTRRGQCQGAAASAGASGSGSPAIPGTSAATSRQSMPLTLSPRESAYFCIISFLPFGTVKFIRSYILFMYLLTYFACDFFSAKNSTSTRLFYRFLMAA